MSLNTQEPAAASVAATDGLAAQRAALEQQRDGGASWFYWIAGLSLVNTVMVQTDANLSFVVGLVITLIVDAVTHKMAGIGKLLALGFSVFVAATFVLFGYLAKKGHGWAFVVGMLLYAGDGLLAVVAQDWMMAGFHAFALFCLWGGFSAHRKLNAVAASP